MSIYYGKWTLSPGSSLLIIHKSFFRPRLDYGDTVYDKPDNS